VGFRKLVRMFSTVCFLSLLAAALIVNPVSADEDHSIKVTPPSVMPGGVVTVSGSGYDYYVSKYVSISWDALSSINTTVDIEPNGTFTCSKVVPSGFPSGTRIYIRVTCLGHTWREGYFTIVDSLPDLKITLNSYSGALGDTAMTVNGTDFSAVPVITVDGNTVTSFITSPSIDSKGSFSASFIVKAITSGEYTIKATDVNGYGSASAIYTVASPKISLDRSSSVVGAPVSITGSGFFPGPVSIALKRAGQSIQTVSGTASSTGGVNLDMIIQENIGGAYVFEVTDAYDNYASAQYSIVPNIDVSMSSSDYKDDITITGTGFAANPSITLTCNGDMVLMPPVTIDSKGSFTCEMSNLAAGEYVIKGTDSGVAYYKSFTLDQKIIASLLTSPSKPGYVGMEMTLICYGFKEGATIILLFDDEPISVDKRAYENGSYIVEFKIPPVSIPSKDGQHTITVSDNGENPREIDFFIEVIPPGVAVLLSPESNNKPKQPVSFTWTPVIDDSGVTYTLQISKDRTFSFSTPVLEKAGLVDSTYKMAGTEELQNTSADAPYFWRVMAVDQAGNKGSWSEARSFTIGSAKPNWLAPVLWVGGVLLIGAVILVLGLWWGRRMAYKSY